MKALWLSLHLVCAGIWLGCVLTEALFERALLGRGPVEALLLAKLHRRVDLVVEIPAFTVLLASGLAMLPAAAPNPWLIGKIGFGALAISANVTCVWLVFRRATAAMSGNWVEFERLDHAQHRWGAVVLLGIIAALALGLWLFAGSTPAA